MLWVRKACLLLLCTLLVSRAYAADEKDRQAQELTGTPDDIAGPIVRATIDRAREAVIRQANLTGDSAEKKKTIAQILDEALEQEFPEEKAEGVGKNYNETAKQDDATVETVIKVSGNAKQREEKDRAREKVEARDKAAGLPPPKPAQGKHKGGLFWGTEEASPPPPPPTPAPPPAKAKEKQRMEANVEQEVDRIIDSQDNVYVLSRPKDSSVGLTLDPQLIRDLTVLITSSTVGGMLLEALRQPVINGFFIAGSAVGPGGLKLIKELVQVESLAQVGVQLLLFTLGLEFSLSKLRAVRSVALIGGVLEIFLFCFVAGVTAHFIGASVHEGIFVGALVSMSSTSIVVKCLTDTKSTTSPHGQITIGTLILQDCMVGLLFAFMPVLSSKPDDGMDNLEVARLILRVTVTLAVAVGVALLIARTLLSAAVRTLAKHASPELYQLTAIAFCLAAGWIFGHLGLSTELGAFVAGVMLSSTDQQETMLHELEHIKHFFLSLFISSTGLVMSPTFLMQHLRILTGGVVLIIAAKTLLISLVVRAFHYSPRTALAVGLSMAQIGEFAFVLLSVASQLGLLPYQVYMLLMGITALSLLLTPFLLQASMRILQEPGDGSLLAVIGKRKDKRSLSVDTEASSPREGRERGRVALETAEAGTVLRAGGGNSAWHLGGKDSKLPVGASMYPREAQLQQRYPP